MIERIILFSAHNRLLVLTVTLALLGFAYAAARNIPLDALPDLSDTQVIIYSRWDRSPDILEDQVTYPIVSALLGAPKVRSIRGISDFGYSYVYVIFEDGTDIYWARSRVLEYLSKISGSLPEGVRTELGPDATSVGWVYQYALTDTSGKLNVAELRSLQDWNIRYRLQSVPGVSEVAAVGGMVRQYQVNINPNALASFNIPLTTVIEKIRASNNEVGGRLLELGGREYMIRGRGYIRGVADIEQISLGADFDTGTPVLLRQVARVSVGPDIRRGVADLDGRGDTPGGIVVMRYGENALKVIERVKAKIAEIAPALPAGVNLLPTYDRSILIEESIATLKETLLAEVFVVSAVILLFLWHLPSATTAIVTIPISVFLAFIPLYYGGQTSNIMSLAGIAISIGVLVDGAIVQVENIYLRIQQWMESDRSESFESVRLRALVEVSPSIFFSLLIIAVAFLPIFTLVDQEGRLFKPLAYSKNLAMAIAALLALTLDPALRMLYTRYEFFDFKPRWLALVCSHLFVGRYHPEETHPVSRLLFRLYEPVCRFVLARRRETLFAAGALSLATVPVFVALGSEFMPPLGEGTILYMPTTLPGIAVGEAERMLQVQDRLLRKFPEVERVFGKVGRADSATDPAPLSMVETTVLLKPEDQWRKRERWYSFLPDFMHAPFRRVWRDRISYDDLVDEMDRSMQLPGWTNAWTMPIQNRINMLSTGIRTPLGIKIMGDDLKTIEHLGQNIEKILTGVPGTRSVFAERVAGGYFLDFELRRSELARHGLSVEDAQVILESALGGRNLTTTVEGRARYPVNLRYARAFRDSPADLERVLVPLENGSQVPMGQLARIRTVSGPSMIRNEDGLLTGYVFIDLAGRDTGSYLAEAHAKVSSELKIPPGFSLRWSGQYENMARVQERLVFILPLTLFLIVLLLYLNTGSAVKVGIVMLAVPFSLVGAVWFLFLLDYNMSIAVWVGMIALMGLDAETGTFMLLYLDLSYEQYRAEGRLHSLDDLREAVVHGAVRRVRPKIMTVATGIIGLVPIMWSLGTGADLMKRIAAPMIGGLVTSFALELLIYPVVFFIWKAREIEFAKRE